MRNREATYLSRLILLEREKEKKAARAGGGGLLEFKKVSGGGRWLLRALLLEFFDLVEQIVCLFRQRIALGGGFDHVGFAAKEQVQIGHGVVVVRLKLDGRLQRLNAVVDHASILLGVGGANLGREWLRIFDLFVDMSLVVFRAHLGITPVG